MSVPKFQLGDKVYAFGEHHICEVIAVHQSITGKWNYYEIRKPSGSINTYCLEDCLRLESHGNGNCDKNGDHLK